jgi:hypothetical protein
MARQPRCFRQSLATVRRPAAAGEEDAYFSAPQVSITLSMTPESRFVMVQPELERRRSLLVQVGLGVSGFGKGGQGNLE